ncbi:MAG: hypothetical protein E6R03_08600 [Hyphomicrobiaceae bacterium]|nr:MAG: hypothetical protein E6R03_08600 [Hyphomicrobiaceae bacterium]
MGDPDDKLKHSARRRNFVAKKLRESQQFAKKVHMSAKDRDKQRKWRLDQDPTGDYESLDNWLVGVENGEA